MKKEFFKKITINILFIIISFGFLANFSNAKEGLGFTITPPLTKTSVVPGQTWKTSIKVVNNSPADLTLYASVYDFKSDITGGVAFYLGKKTQSSEKIFASQWIKISQEPIKLKPYQSQIVPFSIYVPEDAEPGGHYVAIVLGTKPVISGDSKGTAINISSAIASLVLLRVKGDIIEKGRIRDFYTKKAIYKNADVDFNLTFENLGNVHLHPVGAIKIYNMWGKKRGRIPINENNYFGNVLPNSKRMWKFEWKGEKSLFEIGRYKAQVFLSFGEKAKQTSSREVYFWIIPLVPTTVVLGGFTLLFLIIILSVRLYVKRAILVAQKQAGISPSQVKISAEVLKAPFKEMIIDLSNLNKKQETLSLPKISSKQKNLKSFLKKYFKVIIFLIALIFWVWASILYFKDTFKPEKDFEVIQEIRGKKSILVPSKNRKIISTSLPTGTEENFLPSTTEEKKNKSSLIGSQNEEKTVGIINKSGSEVAIDRVSDLIKKQGFKIFILPEETSLIRKTIVKYKEGYKNLAEIIDNSLGGYAVLMEENSQNFDILVILGEDIIKNED